MFRVHGIATAERTTYKHIMVQLTAMSKVIEPCLELDVRQVTNVACILNGGVRAEEGRG